MDFESFLMMEGKLFAYSKDGVRKQVKNDAEAAEWRNTVAKPKKEPKKEPKAAEDLNWVARIIQHEVSNGYPDTDGWDFALSAVRKKQPHLGVMEAGDLLNKAAKKILKVKDFQGYVDYFHKDYGK